MNKSIAIKENHTSICTLCCKGNVVRHRVGKNSIEWGRIGTCEWTLLKTTVDDNELQLQ